MKRVVEVKTFRVKNKVIYIITKDNTKKVR